MGKKYFTFISRHPFFWLLIDKGAFVWSCNNLARLFSSLHAHIWWSTFFLTGDKELWICAAVVTLLIYLRMQRRSQNVTAAFCSFIPVVTSMLVAKGKDPRFEEERMDGGMLRSRGKGQGRRTRGGGRGGAAAGWFFSPSLSPVAVWWKSNSTLALIMWQLEFTYLVNPSSGFRFQLISL